MQLLFMFKKLLIHPGRVLQNKSVYQPNLKQRRKPKKREIYSKIDTEIVSYHKKEILMMKYLSI